MPAIPIATDKDLRDFRRILLQQRRTTQLDHWQGARLRKTLVQINRALGNPNRARLSIQRAVREAVLGTYRSGSAVSARHGIGIATQFLQIFAASVRTGFRFEEFYLHQLYLPDRWRSRMRQVPSSQSCAAQFSLIERTRVTDFQLLGEKHLFAARCKEAGLPSTPVLGEFIDGHPDGKLESLPVTDLFSKPTHRFGGAGAKSWRYDRSQDCFFNAETGQKFSREALLEHLCDLSRQDGRVILQQRLRNHAAISPLTNGALSTLRIVTCRTPFGSIDLMPPVIKMPAGRSVVDNVVHGGLAAPVDLATGTICGPALQKDNCLGVIWTDKHPDSGQELKGFSIPMWTEAVDLARRAHETFPSMHFIGWDIAILQDHAVLVEGNPTFDPFLTVLPHRLSLSDTQFIPYYNFHWAKFEDRPAG
jgi:putative polysaccharide biosynthesis protein